MTIDHAALAIGASLIVMILIMVTLIWRKLRFMDARLSKIQNEHNEFHILYSRLFMTAMNANPKVAFPAEPQNAPAKSNGGEKSHAEVIALAPSIEPHGG
jgi:hypothetical protein